MTELAAELGHRFARPELLNEALTHPSVDRLAGGRRDYDRLEFLGDRILGMVVADMLFRQFPAADAGELARRYNALVRREALAQVAEAIGLGRHLRLSRSERAAGGAAKPAILADACEAVLAALWLDGGLPAAEQFVVRQWTPMINALSAEKDAKTALQEWAHAHGCGQPRYELVEQAGPAHEPLFTILVSLEGAAAGTATARGRSKREAEQAAAAALLATLAGRS